MSENEGNDEKTNSQSKLKVSTLVFLDFETTGLKRPRITELCLLAVNRLDIEAGNPYPRVINKLVACLDPQKPIDPYASSITDLYNDALEHQKPWNENVVNLIDAFLRHLSSPVCLIAHNGNRFDFAVLQAELTRINKTLDNSLYCVDSLEAFRELDGLPRQYVPQQNGYNNNTGNNFKTVQKWPNEQTPSSSTSTPPSKIQQVSGPPPLKRKSMEKSNTNTNGENIKSDGCSKDAECTASKVKKKLDFSSSERVQVAVDSNLDSFRRTEETDKTASDNLGFSESLEDNDYLLALEMVEKELHQSNPNDCTSNGPIKMQDVTGKMETSGVINAAETEPNKSLDTVNGNETETSNQQEAGGNLVNTTEVASKSLVVQNSPGVSNVQKETDDKQGANPILENVDNNTADCLGKQRNGTTDSEKKQENGTVDHAENQEKASVDCADKQEKATVNCAEKQENSEVNRVEKITICTAGSVEKLQNSTVVCAVASGTGYHLRTPIEENSGDSETVEKHTDSKLGANMPDKSESGDVSKVSDIADTSDKGRSPVVATTNVEPKGTGSTTSSPFVPRKSYKLEEIYKRTFGMKPENTHCAEGDCLILMRVVAKTPQFFDWMDKNATFLTSVEPMSN